MMSRWNYIKRFTTDITLSLRKPLAYHYDSHWLAIMIVITQSLAGGVFAAALVSVIAAILIERNFYIRLYQL